MMAALPLTKLLRGKQLIFCNADLLVNPPALTALCTGAKPDMLLAKCMKGRKKVADIHSILGGDALSAIGIALIYKITA